MLPFCVNMVKRILNIFLLITITICFSYCVKKKERPVPDYGNYTPPINLADYCYFKTGSYWVYQDSVSGQLDSQYVYNSYIQTITIKPEDNYGYQGEFKHYTMFTYDKYKDERWYQIKDEDAAFDKMHNGKERYECKVAWTRYATYDSIGATLTPGIFYGNFTYIFNEFYNGPSRGSLTYGQQVWSRGVVDNMKVGNINYPNVAVFEDYINVDTGNWSSILNRFKKYHCKNIGLIKKIDIDSNRVWLLKRYNVIQ